MQKGANKKGWFKKLVSLALGIGFFTTASAQAAEITGAGATFPQPVFQAWAYEYHKATGIKVNYQGIGSGGGIKQAQSKTVDFGASDKPLTSEELKQYNLAQFPAIIGAVVLTYNLPGLKEVSLNLDEKAVCDIYLGKITKWNDPYLQKLNPNIKLPDAPITVVRRSDGSGTTWLFTTYLSKACPEWKNKVGAGTSVDWPVGIGAKGNPGVTNYIKQNNWSIGYVEYTYAKENKLPVARLLNRDKTYYLAPSVETIQAAASHAKWSMDKDFYEDLTYQPGKNSYPIVGASFVLLVKDSPRVKEATKFFRWSFEKGDGIAQQLYYIPLPKNVKSMIYKYWEKHKVN
ncbi:phosphate ABC transporter substrate-binding protein PstS [Thermodesulfobacterium sp. TA1]|uniref:phosphate ABC transporter substrate-binding protein PstS n=1 Tax=Thermodesulfobacterium sp. TA1 TaxID=2234087 RepID=UPI001231E393|nr:phosphate ABC transporter substrate-binding protein PstS [Thermodesulfobacterium sp. TA1]QER42565.1 phosphate ABC transporter substrate-binding protein PstS [Thermodesulfobacterium sp. TA1]